MITTQYRYFRDTDGVRWRFPEGETGEFWDERLGDWDSAPGRAKAEDAEQFEGWEETDEFGIPLKP
jgi:hypothetical protein